MQQNCRDIRTHNKCIEEFWHLGVHHFQIDSGQLYGGTATHWRKFPSDTGNIAIVIALYRYVEVSVLNCIVSYSNVLQTSLRSPCSFVHIESVKGNTTLS